MILFFFLVAFSQAAYMLLLHLLAFWQIFGSCTTACITYIHRPQYPYVWLWDFETSFSVR